MSARRINERRAISHLIDLLKIEGLSGGESDVSAAVRKKLRAAGCKASWIRSDDVHRKIPGDFETGNLIVRLPGTQRAPRRLFVSHLDTVPLCRGAVPVRRGDRIISKGKTGLGGDNRTAVACLVTVIETLLDRGLPHPPLTMLFTVGEEVGLQGSRFVRAADLGRPRLGFNVDGGNPAELTIGALGCDRWEAEILGRAAHAGVHPDHGVSATLIAAAAVSEVAAKGYFGKIRKGRKRGSSNVGRIVGGEATNQVTDRVLVEGESRSHDPRFVTEITATYRKAFEDAARRVKNNRGQQGKIRFKVRRAYEPFRIDRRAPLVRIAVEAIRDLGLQPELRVVDGGLDANHLNARGVPTITLGAGQHRPHTTDEYVVIPEYLSGCRLALGLASSPQGSRNSG
jgi:tripeptide aminopeptidase